jgi:acyl carrier protein
VGYVVGEEGPVAVGVLREHLLSKLPGYMVPSALMGLSRLPLTANGKVDRAALSALEVVDAEVGCVGPSSALETVLLGIWEEFVPRAEIGVDQNFFDLGGHSLLATQVISRVRETFEVDVPLRTLFDAPTVSSFASAMLLDVGTRSQIERMSEMLVSLSGLSEEELEGRLRALEGKGADAWN